MKIKRLMAVLMCSSLLLTGCSLENVPGVEKILSYLPIDLRTDQERLRIEVESEAVTSTEEQIQESESKTEQSTEIETGPLMQEITISATGDCTLGNMQDHGYDGSFNWYYDNNGADYFFSGVKSVFEKDDFTLVNLECVLTESNNRVEKTYNLKGKPEYTKIMTGSSVEGCSLGNNHSSDYGPESLEDTKAALDAAELKYAYNDIFTTYTTEDGLVVGIVSASVLSQSKQYEDYIKNGIDSLREQGANLVIACCHWGIEGDHYPSTYQQMLAHALIEQGADLVVGNHPHVLQGIELYKGKVICYSLGNFCFGGNRNPADKDTAIYQQKFTFIDGELQSDIDARIIPCRISSIDSRNDFHPIAAKDEYKKNIIKNMNQYSSKYSNIMFTKDGKLGVRE